VQGGVADGNHHRGGGGHLDGVVNVEKQGEVIKAFQSKYQALDSLALTPRAFRGDSYTPPNRQCRGRVIESAALFSFVRKGDHVAEVADLSSL